MTSQPTRTDDELDRRIRAGLASLRDDTAATVDVASAFESITDSRGRRVRRILAVAAAGVVIVAGLGIAAWPRTDTVTSDLQPADRELSRTPNAPRLTTTTSVVPGQPTTTVPLVSVPNTGDPSQHLIVGGTIQGGLPARSQVWNLTPGSTEPDGSGCSPGGSDLPDGMWYGHLGVHDEELGLDLACRFTNEAAKWAIAQFEDRPAEDWEEVYVQDQAHTIRPLPLDATSDIQDVADLSAGTWQEVTERQLSARVQALGDTTPLNAWVKIVDGRVEWLDVSTDNYAG